MRGDFPRLRHRSRPGAQSRVVRGASLSHMANGTEISVRRERQQNEVADEVSAVVAVVRPILHGTLFALKQARADRFGGFDKVTLEDLAREYRAGDGDCGI